MEINLLFRIDAGTLTGFGHLARNLILYKACKKLGINGKFLIKTESSELIEKFVLNKLGYLPTLIFLPLSLKENEDLGLVEHHYFNGAQFLVLDHYDITPSYQRYLIEKKIPWAQYDYKFNEKIDADVVINYNISVNENDYKKITKKDSILCLGKKYIFIGDDFKNAKKIKEESYNRILLTFGGGNLNEKIYTLIQKLVANKDSEFDLVTTIQNKFTEQLNTHSNLRVFINPVNIANIYSGCKVAITSGGTTTYELAFLKKPMVIVPIAENQIKNALSWHKLGYAISFNDVEEFISFLDNNRLNQLVETVCTKTMKEGEFIDGQGAHRVASSIYQLIIKNA